MVIHLVKYESRKKVCSHVQMAMDSEIYLAEHVCKQCVLERVTELCRVQKFDGLQGPQRPSTSGCAPDSYFFGLTPISKWQM